jgi:DNA-directed RNA polymerase specialized sigma24 family protein
MREALLAVWVGSMTFDAFARATRGEWRRIAADLVRRWAPPGWVTTEDVEQDLLLAAWLFLDAYRPDSPAGIHAYVTWNAMDKAKKRLHKVRGAVLAGSADRAPSRIERPIDVEASPTAKRFAADDDPEDVLAQIEQLEAVLAACNPVEADAVNMLAATHDFDAVASSLYGDLNRRRELRLGSEQEAMRVASAVLRGVARRVSTTMEAHQ